MLWTSWISRADSLALGDLMRDAYPELNQTQPDAYKKKLSSLKVRLRDGRNWHKMQELVPGILALVPTGEEYHIQNHEYVSFLCFKYIFNIYKG